MLTGKEEDQGTRILRVLCHILAGAAIALLSSVLLLFFMALAVSGGWLPERLMPQLTVAACVLGGFAGGRSAVKHHRARGLLLGLGVGGCFFLLLTTIGYLCFEEMSVENGGAAILAGCLCGGAMASLFGGRRNPTKKNASRKKKGRTTR